MDDFDVIIVGAGISGIDAAYRIQTQLPGVRYTVLEGRDAIGGTWSFFKYPGIRSDSDLYTFGFPWKPWTGGSPIADAGSILKYLSEAIAETGIDKHIQLQQKVSCAQWSDKTQRWSVSASDGHSMRQMQAKFLFMGTGYYDYEQELKANIPGLTENFAGTVVHTQFWPNDLDYQSKRVVIIGSGATAVTLLPVIAQKTAHVTMLQRSPTYIMPIANSRARSLLNKLLPESWTYYFRRFFFLVWGALMYKFCRTFPTVARNMIRKRMAKELPKNIPLDPHFTPRYNPWDQRLCFCPDGDFFQALREGKADVATGTIKEIEKGGILLHGGQRLEADIIVTATGLNLKAFGGMRVTVNGNPIDIGTKYAWNNAMVQDVPNFIFSLGYINASWTLGADATAQLFCRLAKQMQRGGYETVVPRLRGCEGMQNKPLLGLTSTYISEGEKNLPKCGDVAPWAPRATYFFDLCKAKFGDISTGLEFHEPHF
ncbi:hypothetical protein FE257_001788 [Aspergillus nanangensis]|uniref:Flavin-binding monooxygenase n=1 Tax=Aspergillus nanangensis TaxID=2582783 RepID=A0AAD4CEL0_ASPNN|nr:hypothetical protein FE257_001788 [Aspergillus nanangensis]